MTPVTNSVHGPMASSPAGQGSISPGELISKHKDSSGRVNTESVSKDIASVFSKNPDQAKKLYADVKSGLEENGHPMDVRHLEEDVRSALGDEFFSLSQKIPKEGAIGERESSGDGFGADDALSLGLDVLPVVGTAKGLVELAIGRDPITGDEIPRWESVLGLAASVIPGGKAAAKGVGIASDVTKAVGKHGDELVQSVGKGVRSGADDVVGGVGKSDELIEANKYSEKNQIKANKPANKNEEVVAAASEPRIKNYRINNGGTLRTQAEAIDLARSHGVEIPEDINVVFVNRWNRSDANAEYFDVGKYYKPNDWIHWDDFMVTHGKFEGTVPVRINSAILNSDESIVAHLAHEMHELNSLRMIFEDRGAIQAKELARLVNTREQGGTINNLHEQAWDVADDVILRMRGFK